MNKCIAQQLLKHAMVLCFIAAALIPKIAVAQKEFNPNNILTISKEGTKRGSVMRTGQIVKCRLKEGEKVKGELYIYSDHIVIEHTEVKFHEIEMIKPVNFNLLSRQIGNTAFNEFIRRQSGAGFGTGYFIRTGVFTALNLTLLNKKIKTKKGWEFRVQEIQPFNFRRRG
jgi:hypothetical protein